MRRTGAFLQRLTLLTVSLAVACQLEREIGPADNTVASVAVSPDSVMLDPGQTYQFQAFGRNAAGDTVGVNANWSATAGSITSSGLYTADTTDNDATVTATVPIAGVTLSATSKVKKRKVMAIELSPPAASLQTDQTTQFTARGIRNSGDTIPVNVDYSATGGTINPSGFFRAGSVPGIYRVIAVYARRSLADTAAITVTTVPVATVSVSPNPAGVQVGATVQLAATLKDAAGNTLTGRTVTWSSGTPGVATVSATGSVTGVAVGNATITAISEGKNGSGAVTVTAAPPPGTHAGYYVAASGSSSNAGTASAPWTLAYALGGAGGRIRAGDTVWVRGGTYYAPFRSTLTGTAAAPIVVRAYPGERPIIDGVNASGDNFVVAGSWSVIWGLEFTNTMLSRYTDLINHDYRHNNVINNGPHNKYVNLVIHDGGVAFFNYSVQPDVEIYGSIVYNNGWQAPDRGHGHGMYVKSDVGPVVMRDNVIFNQYGYGIHIYTNAGSGLLNNIHAEGNVSFDNGSLSPTGTSANIGNLGEPLANTLGVQDNMTYFARSLSGSNVVLGSGNGLVATGNYVVGGAGISEGTWTNATVTGNTELSATATGPVRVFVRPNRYEPGRANVIVYNPGGQASVTVDLSAVVPPGVRYEVRNVQDLFGAPVASGTGGGAISLPMSGVTPPTPVGMSSSAAPVTGPYFNVFIVTLASP